jgi:hypothetical protein
LQVESSKSVEEIHGYTSAFLVADSMIKLPFADIPVSFQSFILLSLSLLIVIALYLHIFYGYWLDLETDYQALT